MDDYAHVQQLRAADWSLSGLVDACRLELVGGVVHYWFLPETTLRFFRPLAFGLMKLAYTLSDWSPFALHLASLAWHVLASTLLAVLLRRLGAAPLLAWAVAGLFALHPGQVAAIEWIACQSELMVTSFLLGATLCYLGFRGWGTEPTTAPSRRRWAWAAACVVLYVAALGCRENAIMFPFVMLAVELLMWRRRTREAVVLQVVLLAVAGGYLALRAHYLSDAALPPRPYVYTPADPGFVRFVFDKACYYLLGEFLLAPIVPFGGVEYLRERPVLFYGLSLVALTLLAGASLPYLRRRPGLLAPAWLLGFMAPVLPAFASPHHLYLPGVGWAITSMLVLRAIGGATARHWRRAVMWACILVLGAGFIGMTTAFTLTYDTAQAVEDCVATEIAAAADQLHDGDTIYIANLPIIAHYVRLVVEQKTGLRNLDVHVLTWAPRVLGLVQNDVLGVIEEEQVQDELTWVDDRTIELRVAGGAYFAGPMGRLVREAAGADLPELAARASDPSTYTIECIAPASGGDGVQALRFTFARSLRDPHVHLFWGSRVRWACRVVPEPAP